MMTSRPCRKYLDSIGVPDSRTPIRRLGFNGGSSPLGGYEQERSEDHFNVSSGLTGPVLEA